MLNLPAVSAACKLCSLVSSQQKAVCFVSTILFLGSSGGVSDPKHTCPWLVVTQLPYKRWHLAAVHCVPLQVAVCKEQVEWAIAEKRTFLRQRIQLRLASLYLDTAEYQDALKIVGT